MIDSFIDCHEKHSFSSLPIPAAKQGKHYFFGYFLFMMWAAVSMVHGKWSNCTLTWFSSSLSFSYTQSVFVLRHFGENSCFRSCCTISLKSLKASISTPFPLEFEGIKKHSPILQGELGSTAFVSATPYFR